MVELQVLKSDRASWMSFILFKSDLLGLATKLGYCIAKISSDIEPVGGVLLCKERLCLLTNISFSSARADLFCKERLCLLANVSFSSDSVGQSGIKADEAPNRSES